MLYSIFAIPYFLYQMSQQYFKTTLSKGCHLEWKWGNYEYWTIFVWLFFVSFDIGYTVKDLLSVDATCAPNCFNDCKTFEDVAIAIASVIKFTPVCGLVGVRSVDMSNYNTDALLHEHARALATAHHCSVRYVGMITLVTYWQGFGAMFSVDESKISTFLMDEYERL